VCLKVNPCSWKEQYNIAASKEYCQIVCMGASELEEKNKKRKGSD
jgi:hypothetical protein